MTSLIKSISSSINKAKADSRIRNNWDIFVDSIDKQAENKIEQKIEIIDIFIKHYGFDMLINLPYGYAFTKFRELLPRLELIYKGDIIAELSENKSCVYLRCHLKGLDIKDVDLIKFKWYKHFFSGQKFRNYYGETFKINSTTALYNPNKKDDNGNKTEIIGYQLHVSIPEGLKYDDLLNEEPSLSKILGNTFMKWNNKTNKVDIEVIIKLLDNKEPFRIVKCKPYELYVATTYSYKNVLLNFKTNANCIFGGINGSGKSVAELGSIINLASQYDRNLIRIYVGFVSYKADLRLLSKLPQCDYYATSLNESLKLMKFLVKETDRRNKLFESCEKFTTNIFDYNKQNKSKPLPYMYFVSDEITDFMHESGDSENVKQKKLEFMALFNKLSRTGRSAGIWIVVATQRASKENLPPSLKAQLNCVVCFKQINIASAMTLFGSGESNAGRVTRLDKINRECLIENQDGIILAKSLYCTNEMMQGMVDKIKTNNSYINLDKNGNIVVKNDENILKNEQKSQKTEEIKPKSIENEQNYKKVWNSETKSFENTRKVSQWEKYRKGKNKK